MSPDIESQWRSRIQDAMRRLDFARNYCKEVQEEQRAGNVPSADGNFAFQRALRAETAALAHYAELLRTFSELLGQKDGQGAAGEAVGHPVAPTTVRLTTRERQVLTLIANGRTTKEVGHELQIAFKTAACHRSRISAKLGAGNTAGLTRAAIRMGLVQP